LIDTYSGGSSKKEFESEHLRVNKILDFSSTYGVVMGKEARKLRRCFKEYTEKGFAIEIAHHIQSNTQQLKVKIDKFMWCFKDTKVEIFFLPTSGLLLGPIDLSTHGPIGPVIHPIIDPWSIGFVLPMRFYVSP